MKTGSGTVQRAQQTDAALRASNAQLQHAQAGLLAAAAARSTCSPPSAPRRSHSSIAPARSKQQAELNLVVHDDHGAGRRHRRRALAARRPICAGRHAADGGGAAATRSMSSRTSRRRSSPTCATASRSRSRSTAFHGTKLTGHVDSLSPASGLEFALLPPDNATGNFTKIVQRMPVKIVLDDHEPDRPAAPRHVGRADHRHQGDRAGRAREQGAARRRRRPGRPNGG